MSAHPAEHTPKGTFKSDFRRFFLRGLAILLPSVLTLWLLWQAGVFLFVNVAEPINRGIRATVIKVTPMLVEDKDLPAWFGVTEGEVTEFREELRARGTLETKRLREASPDRLKFEIRSRKFHEWWHGHWYLSLTGLIVAIVLIYLAGLLLGGLIGRRVYERVEAWISRIPGFKQVYPHVKQMVDLVMGEKRMAFTRVVLVEYPRQGVWSLGLVTSAALKTVGEAAGEDCLTVFIPSTPTPFTGFAISVRASEVVDLPITVDEALRFAISGGVLIPERQSRGVDLTKLAGGPAAVGGLAPPGPPANGPSARA